MRRHGRTPPRHSPAARISPHAEEAEASEVTRQSTIPRSSPDPTGRQDEYAGHRAPEIAPEETSAFQRVFLPAPERVSDMRQVTAAFLSQACAPQQTTEAVVLVVSELLTNAIRHGRGEISLRVSAAAGRVEVVVVAESSGRAAVKEAGPDDETGRGMFLVDALTHCWSGDAGKTWCVFRYEPEDAGTAA
ncbi:ATP-binding protein [Streptomyces cinereoruber]|uniref:ATP-binding protein n=1 Tax=Streptomyces cinereoruber TaxID=67260 RepID=UPI003C2CA57A